MNSLNAFITPFTHIMRGSKRRNVTNFLYKYTFALHRTRIFSALFINRNIK